MRADLKSIKEIYIRQFLIIVLLSGITVPKEVIPLYALIPLIIPKILFKL